MGITIKSFIEAIGDRLLKSFPGYRVYDKSIEQKSYKDCFLTELRRGTQKRFIMGRHIRDYDFSITFYPSDTGTESFYVWTEKILEAFDLLTVGEDTYHVRDKEIFKDGGEWVFSFAVSFFVSKKDEKALMEELKQMTGVYEGA